jgi:hypothetical protein
MAIIRRGGKEGSVAPSVVRRNVGTMASSIGSAIAIPAPRRKVRRGRGIVVFLEDLLGETKSGMLYLFKNNGLCTI